MARVATAKEGLEVSMPGEPLSSTLLSDEKAGFLPDNSALWIAAHRLRQGARVSQAKLDPALRLLIDEVLEAAATVEQRLADQQVRIDHLESLSKTDELTGLLNRRGFRFEVERALAAAKRSHELGLLVVCDLDHFKAVNDTYGHLAGDTVLQAVAAALLGRTRASDCVARLGGDEFAVLMADTPAQQAFSLARDLNDRLNSLLVAWQGHEIPVSASLGTEPYTPEFTPDQLMLLADQALYRRKRMRLVPGTQGGHPVLGR